MARIKPASSLDPACKLLCLALVSVASFLASWTSALLLSFLLAPLLILEGLRPRSLLRESLIVAAFALFTAFVRLADPYESLSAILSFVLVYALRLLAAFLAGRLFYASTRISDLRDALTRLFRHVPLLKRLDIGLWLSMILGFIPLIFDEWRSSIEAARSRGMNRKARLSTQALLIAAFLRRLMLRSVAVPEALVARGYHVDRCVFPSTWKMRDTMTTIACCSILALAILHLV
jgi:energy-coupling factor transporter transmembrane protein EcfT